MLRVDFENCASCLAGEHNFVNMVKQYGRKVKNAVQKRYMASFDAYVYGLGGAEK